MPVQGITSKIASVIGNKESLIPIMIKDGVDSASLTYHAYKAGGKAEGQDRAVDEFGTQAVWIGGIPFYKKLIDASVYKKSGLNPGVDIRVISNPEYAQWAQKNAKGMMKNDGFLSKLKFLQPQKESVQNALSDALKDGGDKIKKLYRFKVLAAAALTLGSFFALTKYKHSITKKTVLAEVKTENKNQVPFTGKNIPPVKTDKIFEDIAQFKTAESCHLSKGS